MASSPLSGEAPLIAAFKLSAGAVTVEVVEPRNGPELGQDLGVNVDGDDIVRAPFSGRLEGESHSVSIARLSAADTTPLFARLETGSTVAFRLASLQVKFSLAGARKAMSDLRSCTELIEKSGSHTNAVREAEHPSSDQVTDVSEG